jgi:hypothetical protein
VADARLQRGLREAAAALRAALVTEADVPLLYGPLLDAVAPAADDCALAMELIYEGYLLHYRSGRLLEPASRETTLLAGDFFYARGLRLVTTRHDVRVVDLLTRLMASCSCLRALGAPFSHDDDLWVVTVAGLGALRNGATPAPAHAFFDDFARLSGAGPDELPDAARAAARALRLADARALAAFFAGESIGPHMWQRGEVGAA